MYNFFARLFRITSAMAAIGLLTTLQVSAQDEPLPPIDYPNHALIQNVTATVDASGTLSARLTMRAPVIVGDDAMIAVITFDNGLAAVYCLGRAEVPNIPIDPESVVLIRSDRTPVTAGFGIVAGNSISITATSPELVGARPRSADIRYITHEAAIEYDLRLPDLNVYISSAHLFNPSIRSIVVFGLFERGFGESYSSRSSSSLGYISPDFKFPTIPIEGPRPGTPEPEIPVPQGIQRGQDITGDEIGDYDYGYDTPLPSVEGFIVDVRSTDNSLLLVIGIDFNGNGLLDDDEVFSIIGSCVFPRSVDPADSSGFNDAAAVYIDGVWHIYQTNILFAADGKTELARYTYVYNTETGQLKIYYRQAGGQTELVFQGDPSTIDWDNWNGTLPVPRR